MTDTYTDDPLANRVFAAQQQVAQIYLDFRSRVAPSGLMHPSERDLGLTARRAPERAAGLRAAGGHSADGCDRAMTPAPQPATLLVKRSQQRQAP